MAPQRSLRLLILEEIKTRLEAITAGDTFETNAGQKVYLGEVVTLGPDDPEAVLAISPSADQPTWSNQKIAILWEIELQAIAKADLEEPWVNIEVLIADIKRAIELPGDVRLGGLLGDKGLERGATRMLERPEGANTVGAGVTYVLRFIEAWGHPEG